MRSNPRFSRVMRRALPPLIVGLLSLAAWAANAPNAPPKVVLANPGPGAVFAQGTSIALSATASDPNGNLASVSFYDGATLLYKDSAAPFSFTWNNAPLGTHALKAVATDKLKLSTASAIVSITVQAQAPDTQAPSIPASLTVVGATASSLTLSWSASTDNKGVVGYDVYRNGVRVSSPATPGYIDGNLAPSTTYTYAVRARDAAGNVSAQSAPVSGTTTAPSTTPKRVVGYFTQWGIYNQGYLVKHLETSGTAAKLTTLIYAFGNVRNNRCELGVLQSTDPATGAGGDAYADYSRTFTAAESVDGVADVWGTPLRGNWNQLKKLKARHPGLKVLISLGGWNWSRNFAQAARPENRQAFVASCIDAYIRGNLPAFDYAGGPGAAAGVFDGFDIDWEFPAACGLTCGTAEDTANFTALLAEFRTQLDAVRPGLVLGAAVGGGVDKIRVIRPESFQASVDYINLMSYDFHGAWDAKANFPSALFNAPNDPSQGDARYYNTNDAVQALLARGVLPGKINLGISSHGHGWKNVASTNYGLYQSGVPADGSLGDGQESYRNLVALPYASHVDASSRGKWIYGNGVFWSFDDPATIQEKMSYVKVQGLGGAFLWDFSGDDPAASLATALHAGLQ